MLIRRLFEETFIDLGTSLESEGVNLAKCDPNYRIYFHDDYSFDSSTDVAAMKMTIENLEGESGFDGYLRFLLESHQHYELSVQHVLRKNFRRLVDMLRPEFLIHLWQLHPFTSIYSRASLYFRSNRLRRVFTFGSMYARVSLLLLCSSNIFLEVHGYEPL